MRRTKIIATVGPACADPAVLRQVIKAGTDVLRINASHTTPAILAEWIERIRALEAESDKAVGIMVDLQGPRVRVGEFMNDEPARLIRGERVIIEEGRHKGRDGVLTTPCRNFSGMVHAGDEILIDNGIIELRVERTEPKRVHCLIIAGGAVKPHKGMNLPQARATLPALTSKDIKDLRVCAKYGVEYLALSFVRSEQDVLTLKQWLKRNKFKSTVIAKIEKPLALKNIKGILKYTDALMVARGDLGIEIGVEKLPAIQKQLIEMANQQSVPVITATEMLESMIQKPRPTRAEVSDIANAVFDRTDAVMLSEETAAGKNPILSVRQMASITLEAERHMHDFATQSNLGVEEVSPVHAITHAALNAARELKACAIVVFTKSGLTAQLMSKLHPPCPIIAMAPTLEDSRRMTLLRGVLPLAIEHCESTDEMIRKADRELLKHKLAKRKVPVIIASGRWALPGARYMTKVHWIGVYD